MGGASYVLTMRNIRKSFPGVLANDSINLKVRRGEIHALLGENGAGKSTAMNILTGLYREDAGEILVRGEKVSIKSPQKALRLGIAMVHQHFRLVQTFTTTENIILGLPLPRFFLNREKMERKVEEVSREFGLYIDAKAKIWQLSVGEQQRVEIVKMLYRGVEILIMDEPTAVLTPNEVDHLFVTLRKMVKLGKSIIFISHKLDEVMEIAHQITVFRKGRDVASLEKTSTSKKELASLMVGGKMPVAPREKGTPGGKTILSLKDVEAFNDVNKLVLNKVSLQVKEGAIYGIGGVAGNGQRELAEVVVGLRKIQAGEIFLEEASITNESPRIIMEAGISFIPEDRMGMGLVPNLGVVENAVLKEYRRPPIQQGFFLNQKEMMDRAQEFVDGFQIKTASLSTPVRLLSGGNAQRLLLARETATKPKLIVACHPTRGLDISATLAVHRTLLEESKKGVAILLISEDLDELMALAHEISVLYEGTIMGTLEAKSFQREELGLLMAGVSEGK